MAEGDPSVALVDEYFVTLSKYPNGAKWPEGVAESDRDTISALWATLKRLAQLLAEDFGSDLPVKSLVSSKTPSGNLGRDYWACVHPAAVSNKSYGLQLFFIVRHGGATLEFGLGLGSGPDGSFIKKDKQEELHALEQQLTSAQERLAALAEDIQLNQLVTKAQEDGYTLRKEWRGSPGDGGDFHSFGDWARHAGSGKSGWKSSISKFLPRADVVAMGEEIHEYLRQELSQFLPLLAAVYPKDALMNPVGAQSVSSALDELVAYTLWDRKDLKEVLDSLESSDPSSHQVVLAGPPGTGKTWAAKAIAAHFTGEWDVFKKKQPLKTLKLVQFHPSYSYEQFVQGMQPVVVDGAIKFQVEPGAVLQAIDAMKKLPVPGSRFVILIDEMNRANLPRVLGELLYLFEYREETIHLLYSKEFTLPDNLFFIGTMNTADRSIRSIDAALRRRFDVFECGADVGILERHYKQPGKTNALGSDLFAGFELLNGKLQETESLTKHHAIGQTFFMADHFDAEKLRRVWKYKISPLIEEYFYADDDSAKGFSDLSEFWKSLKPK